MSSIRRAFERPISNVSHVLKSAGKASLVGVLAVTISAYGITVPANAAPSVGTQPTIIQPATVPANLPAVTTAAATESGVFVPTQGRLIDTRDGSGGVTGPVAANSWTPIQVLGRAGIPADGASAVVVTLTSIYAPRDSWTQMASNTDRPTDQTTNLYTGADEIMSNTAIVPIGTDGRIALRTSAAQEYVIEVQGYFTDGGEPAPGGYVPILSKRVVDTRDGTGVSTGQWANKEVHTVNLKNVAGIPDTAGSVFANVVVISTDPDNPTPTLYPYPAGSSDPSTPLHFRGGVTTGVGTTLDMNAAGEVSFRLDYTYSPVHVVIDVQGYFDGQASESSYHSLATRLHDTRTTQPVPAGGSVAVQVSGVDGLPVAGTDLAGVAMNITAINTGAATTGWFRAYPSDEAEQPLSNVNYHKGTDIVSNVSIIRPGTTDGKIIVRNLGTAPAHFVIDTQGWFTNANLLPPAVGSNGLRSGERGAASMVGRGLTDAVKVSWNPTNGNTVLTGKLLSLAGIGQGMNISWRYNSLNDARPTLNLGRIEAAIRVNAGNDEVTYTAPDGGWYVFKPAAGGKWTMPPGINATLTKPNVNEYRIRFNDTGVTNIYTDDGSNYSLARSIDANKNNPNTITYTYTDGVLASSKDTQGRTITYEYNDARNLNQPSKIIDTSINRSVSLEYAASQGRLSRITDATGVGTSFVYNSSGKLAHVNDGRSGRTDIFHDTSGRTARTVYAATSTAPSSWTMAYPSATTSTLQDPNARTATYTFNAAKQVTKVLDPNGNNADGVFDGHDNQTESTDGLGNSTTAAYNANNSLMNVTSPAGSDTGTGGDRSFTYNSVAGDPFSNWQPKDSTDSQGNETKFTYDANTNAPKKTESTNKDDLQKSVVTFSYYQGDVENTNCGAKQGSLCRSVDGLGNTTSYAYDAQGNPITITRPAPLGTIANTFDAAGRVLTVKDGKNQVLTYTYDKNDRIKQVRQGATCVAATCVTYTYDANGNLTQRVDASGTSTYAYDAQNRATAKTVGGVTTNLTYDGASNVLTFKDPTGTIGYKYDPANRLISLAEPGGSCPATPAFPNSTKCTGFVYDKNNRRIETKYPNGVKNVTAFDSAGRKGAITATNTSGSVLAKRSYAYTTGTTGKDGSLRKSMTTESGAVTTYEYDFLNRLTSATLAGVTEGWVYDKNGNRTQATKTDAPTRYSTYNAADQLCWTSVNNGTCSVIPASPRSFSYDANGNTTRNSNVNQTYNVFDQFTSRTVNGSGVTTGFSYSGLRNDERIAAGNTSFLNGSLGVTTETTAGATTAFIRDPQGTLISMRTSTGASFYYTMDALGSTILLTDGGQAKAATYSYDSWGNSTSTGVQADANPWQYAGGYKDTETGYTKFGARYYDPTIGRFTQLDPSGQDAHYSYAGNNPISNTDSSGLSFLDEVWDEAGSAIAGAFVTGVTSAISIGLKGSPIGWGAGALIGCGAGLVSKIASSDDLTPGKAVGGCLGGAAGSLIPGAFTKPASKIQKNSDEIG